MPLDTPNPPQDDARTARLALLRQAALALRARLRFHEQCGFDVYPFIAPSTPAAASAGPARQARASAAPPLVETAGSGRAPVVASPAPRVARQSARSAAHEAVSSRPAPTPEALARAREAIRACARCAPEAWSAGPRVLGRGAAGARLMILGDHALVPEGAEPGPELCFGPSEDEMLGKMLDKVLGLSWDEVYVTNLCKCLPPADRADAACRNCLPHVLEELAALRPDVLCLMGKRAADAILGPGVPLLMRRGGRVHSFVHAGVEYAVMVTYHPRFLERQKDMKRAALEDLEAMRARLSRPR